MKVLGGISIVWALACASAPFAPQKQGTALARIIPKQMQAAFSRGASKKAWTDYIYSATNQKLYVLSLEPQVDAGKHTIGIDLILRDAEEPTTDQNLLNPPGNWHGLQPYNFVANDLLQGADKSVFGRRRAIGVKSRGLDIVIQIRDVKVSALPDGTYDIDELKLLLAVDNLPKS
jgi:hypothetical protein